MGGTGTVSRKRKIRMQCVLLLLSFMIIYIGIKNSVLAINHEQNVMDSLCFIDKMDGKDIAFSLFKVEQEGSYYMVLPSVYQKNNFEVEIVYEDRFYSIFIDGKKVQKGALWTESLQEEVHQLKVVDLLGKVRLETAFQVLVSENLPAVLVTVEAKEELYNPKEYANKQYLEKGRIQILDTTGSVVLEDILDRFKVRGNLTSNLPKKPFTLTLSTTQSVCGMSPSPNWNLLANATDSSHIRNKMMLDWSNELSERYTPSGEYVDLFVNGEYQGLYLLTETMETGEERINRNPDNSIMVEMELDYRAVLETNYLATEKGHYWIIHEELPMLEEEKEEIEAYLNEIESALYSEDMHGKTSGKPLEELLDFDSWTDTWLLKEISSDHDLGTTSQFAIVENWNEKSILLAGPEWDFDGTFGNGIVPWSNNPRNLVTANYYTKGSVSVNQNKWLSQMYQNENFRQLLIEKYQEKIQPKIIALLEYEIDEYSEVIRRSAVLDSLRWIGNGEYHNFTVPENFVLGTEEDYRSKYDVLDSHIDVVKRFLREKDNFLTQLWIEGVEFEVYVEEHDEGEEGMELNFDTYTWIPKVSQ